jgi:hypothetical protein
MSKCYLWEIFFVPTMIEHIVPQNLQVIKVLRGMANAHSFGTHIQHLWDTMNNEQLHILFVKNLNNFIKNSVV